MERKIETPNTPALKLTGEDGNAFYVLDKMRQAGKAAGWPEETVKAVIDEATKGDYSHLLATAMKYFEVE